MKHLLLGLLLLTVSMLKAEELSDIYIDTYKSIAISEMHRTGIPASIKLAQGMLESNMGRSVLAVNANNHFGIKCGGYWTGGTYYREDDDRDKNGKLIESCFRVFDSDYHSYIAHSDFLGKKRYEPLFFLDPKDYKGWAKGLSKAGYATDPKYPQKLIRIVEKYNLQQYDLQQVYIPAKRKVEPFKYKYPVVKTVKKAVQPIRKVVHVKRRVEVPSPNTKNAEEYHILNHNNSIAKIEYIIHKEHRMKFINAQGGETLNRIAESTNVSLKKLLRYNEITDEDIVIQNRARVYLSPKKRIYAGDEQWHTVEVNQTLHDISQIYGVKIARLRSLNRFPKNAIMLAGQKISLKKTVARNKIPEYLLKDEKQNKRLRKSSRKK